LLCRLNDVRADGASLHLQDGQDKRRFFRDATASPPPILGLMTNSSTVTFESST